MQVKYLRDKDGNPYATFWTDGERFGWSLCHKDDQFVKKVGIAMAKAHAVNYGALLMGYNSPPQSIRDRFIDWVATEMEYYNTYKPKKTNNYTKVTVHIPITKYLLMNDNTVVSTFFDEKEIDYILNKLNE